MHLKSGGAIRQELSEESGFSRLRLDSDDQTFRTDQPRSDVRKSSVVGTYVDKSVAGPQEMLQHTLDITHLLLEEQEARVLKVEEYGYVSDPQRNDPILR